jgi:hypothetical protein
MTSAIWPMTAVHNPAEVITQSPAKSNQSQVAITIRDVGVEGQNSFTPTIIFPRVFSAERAEIGTTVPKKKTSRIQKRFQFGPDDFDRD